MSNRANEAGALLRAAREVLGLSLDAVAQQLKLSVRQVRALEQGDYSALPGRTFVRGFVRNYARLLKLDPERVLDALPSGAATPTLETPALHATAPTMGELPTAEATKARWTRWAIPVSLVAIVAVAAVYEWTRPAVASRPHTPAKEASVAVEAPKPPADKTETPLPNPLHGGSPSPAQKEDAASSSPAQVVPPSSPAQVVAPSSRAEGVGPPPPATAGKAPSAP
jgi:cytoskeleton protein RodZ